MQRNTQLFDRLLLYAVSLIVLGLLTVTLVNRLSKPKVVYVDIARLVDNYKFRKDIEDVSSKELYRIKNAIDSLKMLQRVSVIPQRDTQIARAQYAFNQYYSRSNQENTKKIWDRLNPLLEAFGKDRGYQLVIGANGAGTVLYGSVASDATDDVINYVNQKYEKGI